MDPFSAEGELVNIHTAFVQGQYTSVLADYEPSSFSESNKLPVQILQYRAQCTLGQYDEVIASISDSDAKSSPDLAAVRTYASYLRKGSEDAIAEAERLAESQGDNLTVELLCGSILARAGKPEQAVQLLSKHQGSLDAVALIVQIHLTQNRTDLATREAKSARSFAQDALLVNLAESWVGMREVGRIRLGYEDVCLIPFWSIGLTFVACDFRAASPIKNPSTSSKSSRNRPPPPPPPR